MEDRHLVRSLRQQLASPRQAYRRLSQSNTLKRLSDSPGLSTCSRNVNMTKLEGLHDERQLVKTSITYTKFIVWLKNAYDHRNGSCGKIGSASNSIQQPRSIPNREIAGSSPASFIVNIFLRCPGQQRTAPRTLCMREL